MTTETLALIPARGGSKGIPRKNVLPMAGTPLIVHTILAARQLDGLRVVVSTDDAEIGKVAREAGAEVPFHRPAELATDEAGSLEVALHAVDALYPDRQDSSQQPSICLLQPTSPLRSAGDIRRALDRHEQTGRAVVSVVENDVPPRWLYRRDADGRLTPRFSGDKATRRQEAETLYRPNGAIYIVRPETLRTEGSFMPEPTLAYEMPPARSVDIDTELDWLLAEALMTRRDNNLE